MERLLSFDGLSKFSSKQDVIRTALAPLRHLSPDSLPQLLSTSPELNCRSCEGCLPQPALRHPEAHMTIILYT